MGILESHQLASDEAETESQLVLQEFAFKLYAATVSQKIINNVHIYVQNING